MKHTIKLIILLLIILFLWTGSALAMSSQNYRLDWFTPMTGGGGPVSSVHYTVNFIAGQTVIGASASEHYGSGLGYWYGLLSEFIRNFLPMVMKN
jgi:hypothetical protein